MSSSDIIFIAADFFLGLVVMILSFVTFLNETRVKPPTTRAIAGIVIITAITIAIIIGGVVALTNPGLSGNIRRLITAPVVLLIPIYILTLQTPSKITRLLMSIVAVGLIVSFIAELILISATH